MFGEHSIGEAAWSRTPDLSLLPAPPLRAIAPESISFPYKLSPEITFQRPKNEAKNCTCFWSTLTVPL